MHGSYAGIIGGQSDYAIDFLTGAPGESINHDKLSQADLESKMTKADNNQWIMSAGTRNGMGNAVVEGHAYASLKLVKVNDNGKTVTLIKMRNPWGKETWKGDWSDSSSKWTAATKAQVNLVVANDGIFYIDMSDYR